MKTNKRSIMALVLTFVCIMTFMMTGCSDSGEDESVNNSTPISGIYVNSDYLFDFDFENGEYVCSNSGRIGKGRCSIENGSPRLDFDDHYYDIEIDESTGCLIFHENGYGPNAENLDGIILEPDPEGFYLMYELSVLDGVRTNDDGVTIDINTSTNECTYTYENGMGSCTVNDDYNGKGVYLYIGGYKAYPMVDINDNIRFMAQELDDFDEHDPFLLTGLFSN